MTDSSILLHQQAISAALSSNWEEALKINQQIIEVDPKNVDVLNRMGRAYFELGDLAESKKYFENSLKNDPYNQIAAKFLKRIETFKKTGVKLESYTNKQNLPMPNTRVTSDFFIEEPGKSKLVNLLKVAEPHKLSLLSPGEIVNLVVKNRGITITDQSNKYLGVVPDDLSHLLIRLIHGGNKYQASIRTIRTNSITILVREAFRSARFKNQPSFLDGLNISVGYSSEHLILPEEHDDDLHFESDEEESV